MALQAPVRPKGIADIVFLLDSSASMKPCIEGVKSYIISFVEGLNSDPQKSLDFRLAFACEDTTKLHYIDFTTDTSHFSTLLSTVKSGGDEITLPALDFCLDLEWRHGCHKTIILMSDEPIRGGARVGDQTAKILELKEKITTLKVMLYIIGPKCASFNDLATLPKSFYHELNRHNFKDFNFASIMKDIGKTVSASTPVGVQREATVSVKRDLYGITDWVKVKKLG
ncbi:VWA domain-containing protein [bacterium]|nr:VWA domain-containing protein [bacterium]